MKKKVISISNILSRTKRLLQTQDKYNKYITDKLTLKEYGHPPTSIRAKQREDALFLRQFLSHTDNKAMSTSPHKQKQFFFGQLPNNMNVNLPNINDYKQLRKTNSTINIKTIKDNNNITTNTVNNILLTTVLDHVKTNEIFYNNTKYKGLIYNEKEIYNKSYDSLIYSSINKLAVNKRNDNLTNELSITLDENDFNINITLSSLKVTFQPLQISTTTATAREQDQGNTKCFTLPFVFLPLFYCYNNKNKYISISLEQIQHMLSLLITFNNNSYEQLQLNDNLLYTYLSSNINSYFIINNNNSSNTNTCNTNNVTPCNNINDDKDKLSSPFLDEYEFIWTTPCCDYKVTLIYPLINVKINKLNITFIKHIHFKLLFYLYENKFLNWDFYTLHYLFSLKKFRNSINKVFTKIQLNQLSNRTINIDLYYHTLKLNGMYYKHNSLCFINSINHNEKNVFQVHTPSITVKVVIGVDDNNVNTNMNEPLQKLFTFKLNIQEMITCYNIEHKVGNVSEFMLNFINVDVSLNRKGEYVVDVVFNRDKFNDFDLDTFYPEKAKYKAHSLNKSALTSSTAVNNYNNNVLHYINDNVNQYFTIVMNNPILDICKWNNEHNSFMPVCTYEINHNSSCLMFKHKDLKMFPRNVVNYINEMNKEKDDHNSNNNNNSNKDIIDSFINFDLTPKKSFKRQQQYIGRNFRFRPGRSVSTNLIKEKTTKRNIHRAISQLNVHGMFK